MLVRGVELMLVQCGLRAPRLVALTVLASLLAGCATTPFTGQGSQRLGKGEAATLLGPAVRTNQTPLEASLACFADHLAATQYGNTVIGVGEIKDYTGKYSINEGNAVTQGGSLMVYSALGKLGNVITIAERYDPSIGERELGYVDRRQLGDGQFHEVDGQKVRWLPYFGGSIARSDYYIVGGITELNYNISSGGAELGMNGIGGKTRVYNQSVAIDLRIVDSKTLLVLKTVTLTKQYTGHEVGLNIFRFFGSDLFDINIGSRAQEPLQLGIRATLEEATMRLVGAVTRIDPEPCLAVRTSRFSAEPAEKMYGRALDGRPILNPLVAAQREVLAQRANGVLATDPLLPGLVKNPVLPGAPVVDAEPKRVAAPPAPKAVGKQPPAPPPIPSSDGLSKSAPKVVPATAQQTPAPHSAAPAPRPAAASPAPTKPAGSPAPALLNRMPAGGQASDASALQVQFEFGAVTIASASISTIEAIAARWQQGPVNVTLVSRDIENLDPAKRDALIDQRLAILHFALERKGVPKTAIRTTWRPARNDATIYRDGPGLQEIAKIRLEK
jgi:curli biogenesis system outer membrane secretion channel CsgG